MSIYEYCPECKKKGFHYDNSADPIQLCITPNTAYICRYCDYQESEQDNYKRIKLQVSNKTSK